MIRPVLGVLVVSALVALSGVATGQNASNATPGQEVSVVVETQEAGTEAAVETRAFEHAFERDRAEALRVHSEDVERRADALSERRRDLERARASGEIDAAGYAVGLAVVEVHRKSLESRSVELERGVRAAGGEGSTGVADAREAVGGASVGEGAVDVPDALGPPDNVVEDWRDDGVGPPVEPGGDAGEAGDGRDAGSVADDADDAADEVDEGDADGDGGGRGGASDESDVEDTGSKGGSEDGGSGGSSTGGSSGSSGGESGGPGR